MKECVLRSFSAICNSLAIYWHIYARVSVFCDVEKKFSQNILHDNFVKKNLDIFLIASYSPSDYNC